LAYELAQNWIYANHKGYNDTNEMFEKVRIQYFIGFASYCQFCSINNTNVGTMGTFEVSELLAPHNIRF
jgi:hypothetical protein